MIALTKTYAMIERWKVFFPAGTGEKVDYGSIERFKRVYNLKLQKEGGLGNQPFASRVVVPITGLSLS
jgi:hypothetical protein